MTPRTLLLLLSPVLAAALIAACGNVVETPDGDDGGPAPDDGWCQHSSCKPGDTEVQSCPLDAKCYSLNGCLEQIVCQDNSCTPSCPAGSVQVSFCGDAPGCFTQESCGTTISCIGPCMPAMCDVGDTLVDTCPEDASCYTRMGCNGIITCMQECSQSFCDPGDTAVGSTCPTDVSCYTVESCDGPLACLDDFPQHGCPQVEPPVGSECIAFSPGATCDYPSSPGCFHELVCDEVGEAVPTWFDQGTVCQVD